MVAEGAMSIENDIQVPISQEEMERGTWKPYGGRLSSGDLIRYKVVEDDGWIRAVVRGRGGKASGNFKHCFNVVNEDGREISINGDKLAVLEVNDSVLGESPVETLDVLMLIPVELSRNKKYDQAKADEVNNFKRYNAFEEVSRDESMEVLSCRWVITEKIKDNEPVIKARLVIRGFEELMPQRVDSPTASKSSIRLFLSLAVIHSWEIQTLDVKSAFLQGRELEREVYCNPPPEFRHRNIVWKLKRAVYGLGDASRNWFLTVKAELIKLDCLKSNLDQTLFYWYDNGILAGLFLCHVDDFLISGSAKFVESVIKKLMKKFEMGKGSVKDFSFLGWSISSRAEGIRIDQTEYINTLEPIELTLARSQQKQSMLNEAEQKQYQRLLGKLNWVANESRPDLKFDLLEASMLSKSAVIMDLQNLNKCVYKAQGNENRGILLPALGEKLEDLYLAVFADASFANLSDGYSSCRGCIIFLVGNQSGHVLMWNCNKIRKVVRNVLAAESSALCDAIEEACELRITLVEAVSGKLDESSDLFKIVAYTDSKSLYDSLYSDSKPHEKKVRIDVAALRQYLELGHVRRIVWICSKDQLADGLTKRGVNASQLLDVLADGLLNLSH